VKFWNFRPENATFWCISSTSVLNIICGRWLIALPPLNTPWDCRYLYEEKNANLFPNFNPNLNLKIRAVGQRRPPSRRIRYRFGVHIRSSDQDPEYVQKYVCDKIFMKIP